MALDITTAFNEFNATLSTTRAESLTEMAHRDSIRKRLTDQFDLVTMFRSGSFGNGTNVSGYSDVDYFAIFPRGAIYNNSSDALADIAESLRERFPQTNIRVNSPAVRVDFGGGEEVTEVVPVFQTGHTVLGFRAFEMPDGAGGWKFSAPESHNAYVSKVDATLDSRVKPLVRFLKAWKILRGVEIKSFALEIFVARYAYGEQYISYEADILRVMATLYDSQLFGFSDPRFPNDDFTLDLCGTEVKRQQSLNQLRMARDWAAEAIAFDQDGKLRSAFERWDLVFRDAFPTYTNR